MKKKLFLMILTISMLAFLPGVVFCHTCDDPFKTPLIAGGGNPASALYVGDVQVCNDGRYLYVKYLITNEDWCLEETHLHVATSFKALPQTKKGNPIPGQFKYSHEHDCVLKYTYRIPLKPEWSPGTVLFIAAHAALECPDEEKDSGPNCEEESAWAAGADFPGKNWATYFHYVVQEDVCECDLNGDGKCDILDYQIFSQDWGRTDCGTPPGEGDAPNDCECDLNQDGSCNILDFQIFSQDWGRTDCTQP